MKYQSGKAGRIFVVRFEDHDDILAGLEQIARNEDIRAASIQIVGGMREGSIVVGPEKDEIPPKPLWRQLGESNEVLGFGTIRNLSGSGGRDNRDWGNPRGKGT